MSPLNSDQTSINEEKEQKLKGNAVKIKHDKKELRDEFVRTYGPSGPEVLVFDCSMILYHSDIHNKPYQMLDSILNDRRNRAGNANKLGFDRSNLTLRVPLPQK